MRILGLDIGEKRIGVAISDPLEITAQPLSVLNRSSWKNDMQHLINLINLNNVQLVVVGVPRQLNGSIGPQGEKVINWIKRFRINVSITVIEMDERFSTKESERVLIEANISRKKRKTVVDKMAAALILNKYLQIKRKEIE